MSEKVRRANQELVDWKTGWLEQALAGGTDKNELDFDDMSNVQEYLVYSVHTRRTYSGKFKKDLSSFARAMALL